MPYFYFSFFFFVFFPFFGSTTAFAVG